MNTKYPYYSRIRDGRLFVHLSATQKVKLGTWSTEEAQKIGDEALKAIEFECFDTWLRNFRKECKLRRTLKATVSWREGFLKAQEIKARSMVHTCGFVEPPK